MVIGPEFQVRGAVLQGFVEAFGGFSILAGRFLTDAGIGTLDESGMIQLDSAGWYSMNAFVRVYLRIEREVSASIVYKVGLSLPRNVPFPPHIQDVESALRSIDVAYHMNHGRGGEALFDPETGILREGIGHYRVRTASKRQAVVECEDPYPCDLDRGLVEAVATRFQPAAKVAHDPKIRCRKQGGTACHFVVEW
jgi:hypothetical protein